MPGILPMKVIKVGNNAQSRIAQACDRCRSKKIRCDGFRPTCSQCANVGFECKTSDKLSRRAFPRGYTESLEERVRALEGESRELKDLLDEKDEKIDMLSKMQSQSCRRLSSTSPRRPSLSVTPTHQEEEQGNLSHNKEDIIKVQQSPFLYDGLMGDGYFIGTSSTRSHLDAFKRKMQESGRSSCTLDVDLFFPSIHLSQDNALPSAEESTLWIAPPRLFSDKMVNVFFQEWAPLFPIIHRPTFLSLYERYVAGPTDVDDMKSLALLNLVFGIAALSSNNPELSTDIDRCELQWQTALDSFVKDVSLVTLQCMVLAQLYCLQKGDLAKIHHYKSLSVGLSQRLGLHQSQKRFAQGALTSETRKKIFWSLYTVDCFSAAFMGLPRLLQESDVHCEYPVDADDEYVTEQGFQPTLPGEATKISAALALFRACRVLAKTLDELYPSSAAYELSLRKIQELNEELDNWYEDLPPHLRLQFVQGKPSTNTISSRCPLLCLTYHFIRVLIHRPVLGVAEREQSSASTLLVASSSKSMIQILSLLEERNLSFSFCLNRNDLLTLSGFGLLFQALDVDRDGKLVQDIVRLLQEVVNMLDHSSAPGAQEFRTISRTTISTGTSSRSPIAARSLRASEEALLQSTESANAAILSTRAQKSSKKEHKHKTSQQGRRATVPYLPTPDFRVPENSSGASPVVKAGSSVSPTVPASSVPRHLRRASTSISSKVSSASVKNVPRSPATKSGENTNLDYYSFPGDSSTPPHLRSSSTVPTQAEWDQILASIEASCPSVCDTSNAGPHVVDDDLSPTSHADSPDMMASKLDFMSSPDDTLLQSPQWSSNNMWTFDTNLTASGAANTANSVLSFSDESFTSGEEFSSVGDGGSTSGLQGIVIPRFGHGDIDNLDFEDLTA